MAEAPKRSNTIRYVIGCVALLALSVPCLGIAAAIAIPAFVNYTRRAKTTEVRANLTAISHGVIGHCLSDHVPGTSVLPDALLPTIAEPNAMRQMGVVDARWADLGFFAADPLYYSYSIERPDASSLHIVGEGDLDGDGQRSHYEIDCTAVGENECMCGELVVENELE